MQAESRLSLAPQPFQTLGVGIGLRAPHYRDFLAHKPKVDWLEVHTENVFEAGGWDSHVLDQLRWDYPISLHGVGLGIGSAAGFSDQHLKCVVETVRRFEPTLVSEHLCWGAVHDRHLNDLLPLPLTQEALLLVADRIDRIQQALGRRLLLENVSTYLRFRADRMSEAEFLAALVQRTGCGVLLDINNLYVNQFNHAEDPLKAFAMLAPESIGEMHLAGHMISDGLLIDHHGAPVAAPVWALYEEALRRFGPVSTLIEWDTDIPALSTLLEEATRAQALLRQYQPNRAAPTVIVAPHDDPVAPPLIFIQQKMSDALFDAATETTILELFNGNAQRAEHGLALYRGNLAATWNKALASAFPVLNALVGDEFFAALARAYGRSHPSSAGDLNRYGAGFADFLDSFAPVAPYPYFPDMARCEWALHLAHYAPDLDGITSNALATLNTAQFGRAVLRLHPACQLIASRWPIVEIWQAHQPDAGGIFPADLEVASYAITVRRHWHAQLLPLTHAAYIALHQLQAGATLDRAIDSALAIDANFDLVTHLLQWIDRAVVVGIDTEMSQPP